MTAWTGSAATSPVLTMVHPTEGQALPGIKEVFAFGEVTPGSTLTLNGTMIKVHPKGGYLAMVPLSTGSFVIVAEATTPTGEKIAMNRRLSVAGPAAEIPLTPFTFIKESVEPSEDIVLSPGDSLRVTVQASPQSSLEFSIPGVVKHVAMNEKLINNATETARGFYEAQYIIQPGDVANRLPIEVSTKVRNKLVRIASRGKLTIDPGTVPRVGVVTDDILAVRTGPEGGYDLFLYKGMRVRLTGKIRNQRRVRLSSLQSGWVKDTGIQELPVGSPSARSYLNNIIMTRQEDSTLIRMPLEDQLPYRVEQSLDPMQLVITLHGAIDKTDLIRYDANDRLIRQVRWKQISPDVAQVIIEPHFSKWWGYDVRYEGNNLMVEIRKPWSLPTIKGMTIAIDPGHGGPELGAIGPHGTYEKDGNLAIARVARNVLEAAGARVIMTRDSDMDVPLYERSRIAWRNRAHVFVSVHCNSSGIWENPTVANGFSVYSYHPQSLAFAKALHAQYEVLTGLPDRGLFYSDFAVNRMTQMPAILTEQAYIIVPEQEDLIFNPTFQQKAAQAILNGIQQFIQPPAR